MTKNFEIYIIEIPKYKKYSKTNNNALDDWVKFIENPEEINMENTNNNEEIKKAKDVLEEISADEREQELAFQRLMYIMDQKAIEAAGFDKGLKQGKEQGIKRGIKQGASQKQIEIARKLLSKNMEINEIIEITGLTKEEIEKL